MSKDSKASFIHAKQTGATGGITPQLFVGLFAIACGSDSNVSPTTAMVGTSGGDIVLSNGSGVKIPAGALGAPVTITAAPGDAPDSAPVGLKFTGPVLRMSPEGQVFIVPVTVTVANPEGGDRVLTRPLGGGNWAIAGNADTPRAGFLSVSVSHFSEFVAAGLASGGEDGGTLDGSVDGSVGGIGGTAGTDWRPRCNVRTCGVTIAPSDLLEAEWSPDGRILFLTARENQDFVNWLFSADLRAAARLSAPPGLGIWSPNSEYIAIQRIFAQETTSSVVGSDGCGSATPLGDGSSDVKWSPDGRTALFPRKSDAAGTSSHLYRANAGSWSAVRQFDDPLLGTGWGWSPLGSFTWAMTAATLPGGKRETRLSLFNWNDRKSKTLAFSGVSDWFTDASAVFFLDNVNGGLTAASVTDGTAPMNISSVLGARNVWLATPVASSPPGIVLGYSAMDGNRLVTVEANATVQKTWFQAPTTQTIANASADPFGGTVVFSVTDGVNGTTMYYAAGNTTKPIFGPSQLDSLAKNRITTAWHPNGFSVLYGTEIAQFNNGGVKLRTWKAPTGRTWEMMDWSSDGHRGLASDGVVIQGLDDRMDSTREYPVPVGTRPYYLRKSLWSADNRHALLFSVNPSSGVNSGRIDWLDAETATIATVNSALSSPCDQP